MARAANSSSRRNHSSPPHALAASSSARMEWSACPISWTRWRPPPCVRVRRWRSRRESCRSIGRPMGRWRSRRRTAAPLADHVVLAAGSWSGQVSVAGAASVEVKPIRGQLLHLSWQTSQPLRHVLWSAHGYLVPWLNGRVLVGATVEDAGFDERATAEGVAGLLTAGCELVPQLWQASFTEVRVGLRPALPDGLPCCRAFDGSAGARLRGGSLPQRRAAHAADRGAGQQSRARSRRRSRADDAVAGADGKVVMRTKNEERRTKLERRNGGTINSFGSTATVTASSTFCVRSEFHRSVF